MSLLQGRWEWLPRGQPRKGPASLHPAGIMPLNDKRSSPATGSEQSLGAPSESFVFPFQRVLARTAQMPLSLLVAPELGFHPWPGPRDAGWFSLAEEAVLSVSAEVLLQECGRDGSGRASWNERTFPFLGDSAAGCSWKWPWGEWGSGHHLFGDRTPCSLHALLLSLPPLSSSELYGPNHTAFHLPPAQPCSKSFDGSLVPDCASDVSVAPKSSAPPSSPPRPSNKISSGGTQGL